MPGRDRLFSGQDVYSEGWTRLMRDVFFYCLGVAADNFGTFPIGPHVIRQIAVATYDPEVDSPSGKHSQVVAKRSADGQPAVNPTSLGGTQVVIHSSYTRRVAVAFKRLCRQRVVLVFENERGERFGAFRKWQDRQHISYHGVPGNPFPTEPVFRNLSEKTQALFRKGFGGSCPAFAVAFTSASAVAVACDQERPSRARASDQPDQALVEPGRGETTVRAPRPRTSGRDTATTAKRLAIFREMRDNHPDDWATLSAEQRERLERELAAESTEGAESDG